MVRVGHHVRAGDRQGMGEEQFGIQAVDPRGGVGEQGPDGEGGGHGLIFAHVA
jgi:hypothetical protein